ncbi:hypothetical protein Patl1_17930 [Pistacia atlantica]|uniref:Uncharacterized protein n=1 Tax=Pistacia atlantica TaxID=434234 RepID=A0ACC1C041_9ROSI|nr:hypothetical protein Patl1_17930 [Pistacia atlantica]
MGCLVGLMYYLFHVKIISLLEEKRIHPDFSDPDINEVDIYKFDPSDLPGLSESDSDEQGWYFFCEPYYKLGVGGTSKEDKTDWVMHEFYVKDENNPRYKKDFVVCFIEKKSNNKSAVSTSDDGQPSDSLSSVSISHNTENPYTEVESQTSSSHNLISDSGKNYYRKFFFRSKKKLAWLMVEPRRLQTTNLVTDPGSLFPESTTSAVEPQLLFCGDFVPDQMYHIPEITCLMQVDPQLLAESDATSSRDWLNDSPIPSPAVAN